MWELACLLCSYGCGSGLRGYIPVACDLQDMCAQQSAWSNSVFFEYCAQTTHRYATPPVRLTTDLVHS